MQTRGSALSVDVLTNVDHAPAHDVAVTESSLRQQTDRRWSWHTAHTPLADLGGEWVLPLPPGARLEPTALGHLLAVADDDVDLVYADELVADGVWRKPDWSPERLKHHHYVGPVALVRRSVALAADVDDLDRGLTHAAALRIGAAARRIVHVSEPLVTLPEPGPVAGPRHELREPDLTTPVSVIIPTIGSDATPWGRRRVAVVEAVRSLAASSAHTDLEFVVVYDRPTPAAVLDELRSLPDVRLRLVEFTEPFNFAAKCNVGFAHATGEVLLFLNDDTEAISEGAVERLIAPLREADVGATGARLLFEDGTLQHAGVRYGDCMIRHHYYREVDAQPGDHGDLVIDREVTAVTGAALAVRREVYVEAGGFTEHLPNNYNDVDFCLKLGLLGYRVLWLHDVVLYHFESLTRERAIQPFERQFMNRRWGNRKEVRDRFTSRTDPLVEPVVDG